MFHKRTLAFAVSVGLAGVSGQQFDFPKVPYDTLGLSTACTATLNTVLEHCDSSPRMASVNVPAVDMLPADELAALCVPACRDELQANASDAAVNACLFVASQRSSYSYCIAGPVAVGSSVTNSVTTSSKTASSITKAVRAPAVPWSRRIEVAAVA
ncbi:hypothetical protein SBRCBS47491_003936 [Sporothrix bragantina]|uniref:Uncharacterized protein n=1 Tax=Sporothrix bragantina TaxID=671064 RepID=A0ABP0BJL0_9PEZI